MLVGASFQGVRYFLSSFLVLCDVLVAFGDHSALLYSTTPITASINFKNNIRQKNCTTNERYDCLHYDDNA